MGVVARWVPILEQQVEEGRQMEAQSDEAHT